MSISQKKSPFFFSSPSSSTAPSNANTAINRTIFGDSQPPASLPISNHTPTPTRRASQPVIGSEQSCTCSYSCILPGNQLVMLQRVGYVSLTEGGGNEFDHNEPHGDRYDLVFGVTSEVLLDPSKCNNLVVLKNIQGGRETCAAHGRRDCYSNIRDGGNRHSLSGEEKGNEFRWNVQYSLNGISYKTAGYITEKSPSLSVEIPAGFGAGAASSGIQNMKNVTLTVRVAPEKIPAALQAAAARFSAVCDSLRDCFLREYEEYLQNCGKLHELCELPMEKIVEWISQNIHKGRPGEDTQTEAANPLMTELEELSKLRNLHSSNVEKAGENLGRYVHSMHGLSKLTIDPSRCGGGGASSCVGGEGENKDHDGQYDTVEEMVTSLSDSYYGIQSLKF